MSDPEERRTGERLCTDLTGATDAAVRLVCVFLHRLATDRPGTPEGDLALSLSADLDDALTVRARHLRELEEMLDET